MFPLLFILWLYNRCTCSVLRWSHSIQAHSIAFHCSYACVLINVCRESSFLSGCYITAAQPVVEIFKIAGYLPDISYRQSFYFFSLCINCNNNNKEINVWLVKGNNLISFRFPNIKRCLNYMHHQWNKEESTFESANKVETICISFRLISLEKAPKNFLTLPLHISPLE